MPTPNADNWFFVAAAFAATWIVILSYWIYVHGAVRRARSAFESAAAGRAEGPR